MTGSLGSLTGSLGSGSAGTGSLANALPWITGAPNGALPVLTGRTKAIEMVTGPGSPNNTIERFNVSGTDLGIMWDNGLSGPDHDVLMAFGDTVGDCDTPGDDWRSNVLFRSNDTAIADGMKIDSSPLDGPNHSKEIIPGFGIPGEFTTIRPLESLTVVCSTSDSCPFGRGTNLEPGPPTTRLWLSPRTTVRTGNSIRRQFAPIPKDLAFRGFRQYRRSIPTSSRAPSSTVGTATFTNTELPQVVSVRRSWREWPAPTSEISAPTNTGTAPVGVREIPMPFRSSSTGQ